MEALLYYFVRVLVTSAILFAYYRVFLKDRTFHHYNRFFLLAVFVVSPLLPLLRVNYFTVKVDKNIALLFNGLNDFSSGKALNENHSSEIMVLAIIILISVLFLLKFLFGILKIFKLKKNYLGVDFQNIKLYETALPEAPFSFFRNLFWKDSIPMNSDLGRQILKHEMVHIEQKHSADKIFAETLSAVFWFNPIFYMVKKELYLIHEYLADNKAVKNAGAKAFAEMILAAKFPGAALPGANPFLSSNLKKRLKMLQKPKTKYSYLRRIAALPLLFAMAFVYLIRAENREIAETNRQIETAVSQIKNNTVAAENGTEILEKISKKQDKTVPVIVEVNRENTFISPGKNLKGREGEIENATSLHRAEISPTDVDKADEHDIKLTVQMREMAKIAQQIASSDDFGDAESAPKVTRVSTQKMRIIVLKNNGKIVQSDERNFKSNFSDPALTKIYINGKLVDETAMRDLDPQNIEHIDILREDDSGSSLKLLKIRTK